MTTVTAPVEIVGYLEAVTADRILGWAWAPGCPDVRVTIELRAGLDVIADATADLPRPDLLSNGIGDGRHAYSIDIPDPFRARVTDLQVFARIAGGEATPIGRPPAAEGLGDQMAKLVRGMEFMANSQRLLHRNVQAALTVPKDAAVPMEPTVLARMIDLQAQTELQLASVERFVIRLEQHLARLSSDDTAGGDQVKRFPTVALWTLGASSVALMTSLVCLIRSLGS